MHCPNNFCLKCIFLVGLTISLLGCSFSTGINEKRVSKDSFMLDTVVTVTLYDGDTDIIDRCFEKCARYEKIFSRTDPESELYALNHTDSMDVSDELLEVLKKAIDYCKLSGGAFDITLGNLSDMYAFASDAPYVPTDAERAEAISHAGYKNIIIEGHTVTRADTEAAIDLGAIAKGYIADKLAAFLSENGKDTAVISLGGNVFCLGCKPDGSSFNVGIQYPFEEASKTIAVVDITDSSVVTSGIYERSFEHNGVLYHHILDSKTGLPYQNGLLSVTVVSSKSIDGDALSTVCFALGLESGMELINRLDGISALFVTEDYIIHYSDDFPISIK